MTLDDLERLLAAAHAAPPPTARGYDRWDQERREATQEILRVFPELLARLRAAEAALAQWPCQACFGRAVVLPFGAPCVVCAGTGSSPLAGAALARLRAPLEEEQ